MRTLTSFVLAVLLAATLMPRPGSAEPASPAPQRIGTPITVKKPVDLAKLARHPEKFAGRTLRLEGVVKRVCEERGCWVEVESPKGATFVARSLDESVLLPTDCQGRKVVVQGLLTTLPAAAAEEPAEPGHACPRPRYVLSTQGVELAAK